MNRDHQMPQMQLGKKIYICKKNLNQLRLTFFLFLQLSNFFPSTVLRPLLTQERGKEAYTSVRFNAASSRSALVPHGLHHQSLRAGALAKTQG